MQKIDLLSASRCNLLSSTLAAYQQALLKFWENTSRTMTQVSEQFKGLPTYQFQMLKSLNPLTLDAGDIKEKDEEGKEEKPDKESDEGKKELKNGDAKKDTSKEDDDDQLISLDHSPLEEKNLAAAAADKKTDDDDDDESLLETDLLGDDEASNGNVDKNDKPSAFIDLLGDDDLLPPKHQSGMWFFCLMVRHLL